MAGSRLDRAARINRGMPLSFTFEGRTIPAFEGDTLASALLASGQMLVGRSFKYHRPRGMMAAGVEDPNALLHLGTGAEATPNVLATVTEARSGAVTQAQNTWPSLDHDIGSVNGLMSRFLGAGFYYKTFIGPFAGTRFWMVCEHIIRNAAGMGRGTTLSDPDSYEKLNAFCDMLVVGGGPAGLMAALEAGRNGQDVLLVEQDFAMGGGLLSEPLDGAAEGWLSATLAELRALPNVTFLTRTTAFGAYDSDVWALVEDTPGRPTRQRYWLVRTGRAVMATGALERPLVFAGNDLPGVMLAGAARRYLNRHAVLCGRSVVVGTNNDSAYATALDMARAGASVTLCDLRQDIPATLVQTVREAGVTLRLGHGVLAAKGRKRVNGVIIAPMGADGRATGAGEALACDLIAVSGGWAPTLHLWSQRFGKPVHAPEIDGFVPGPDCDSFASVGAAAGDFTLSGADLPSDPFDAKRDPLPVHILTDAHGNTPGKAFVDFQHDVKLADIDQAHLEGFISVEHLKRYTTSGMATDQGKTSNLNALSRLAALRGAPVPQVGTTTFRPPFTPVTIGALVGHEHGHHFRPTRLSPLHDRHVAAGAVMTEAGAWMRPWYYPQADEDLRAASLREAAHVRQAVGMVDVSTLGKIAVQGPDAAEFLNRIYVNGFKTLAVGRLRYGVMLRDDGIVLDDGAVARLGAQDYVMTTTTANAAKVLSRAEFLLQTDWRDLRCHVTSVTDRWAAVAVAGPQSRALLSGLCPDADLSAEALPNNHFTHVSLEGVPCRLHRMSYSGELAYEVYIPAPQAGTVWDALHDAGAQPYGTEAMGILRIEKGHVAGAELDGRTTLRDLGMAGFASTKKPFAGCVLGQRPVLTDPERPSLVGLRVIGDTGAKPGALLFARGAEAKGHGEGWVSSTTWSPALKQNIALAFLARGMSRAGETLRIVSPVDGLDVMAEVVSPHFFDPEGERQNA